MKLAAHAVLVAAALALALLSREASAAPEVSAATPASRQLVDGLGATVQVPARAARIVALAPELAEIAQILGVGDALVGRCDTCDRPASLATIPSVGSIIQPSLESILALRPDLVLASSQGNPLEIMGRLRELGITIFGVAPAASGLAGVAEEVRIIGAAVGRMDEAAAVATEFEARLAALRAVTATRPRTRACLLLWTDPMIAAGEGSFLADLLDAAGADNACAVSGRVGGAKMEYPRLSREDLLLARPDVLLLAIHEASAAAFVGWGSTIPAIRDGRVIALEPDDYLRPSPALAAAAEALAARLQAELARHDAPATGVTSPATSPR